MPSMVDLTIAGRTYQVACRDGEEETLKAAARLVDGKSREAISGLGSLSEARQFLFASLLLADQLIDKKPDVATAPPSPDPILIDRAETLAQRLESLAEALEREAAKSLIRQDGLYPVRAFGKSLRLFNPMGAVPARTLVWIIRCPPDVWASEDFRANGHGGPVTSLSARPAGTAGARDAAAGKGRPARGRARCPEGLRPNPFRR